jgi:hypothetical protein
MEVDPRPKGILIPNRMKKHQVAVVVLLAMGEVKTSFGTDFVFSTEKGTAQKLNIGNQHQLFFKHMCKVSENQTIHLLLLPTQDNSSTIKVLGDLMLFP